MFGNKMKSHGRKGLKSVFCSVATGGMKNDLLSMTRSKHMIAQKSQKSSWTGYLNYVFFFLFLSLHITVVGLSVQRTYLNLRSSLKQHIAQFVSLTKDFFYLNPQFKGISSLSRTSLRLPLGQYSVTMATFGTSTQPPMNLQRLGWSSSLWKSTEITAQQQFS